MRPIFIFKLVQKKELFIFLFAFLAFSLGAIGQKTISGTVKDETGNPIPDVNITVSDDNRISTATDSSGNFSLNLPAGMIASRLLISSQSYQSQDVLINNRTVINIMLVVDNLNLTEVLITGYTSQKKKDIIGAVAVVDMKSMKSIPSGSATLALQGQASGVNVISSGVPGGESMVLVRGLTSFGNNQPLVLVDGVQSNITNMTTDDIESIQVLKDAGAASIYGVRGSNGVIIVTTKKGKSGAPVISYHGYYGTQYPESGNPLNVLNSTDFARLHKIAYPNSSLFANGIPDYLYGGSGGRGTAMAGDPAVDPSNYIFDSKNALNNHIIQQVNKTGTDWYHEFFKPAGITNHNITASGGTNKSNYLFSLGYFNQEGTIIETFLKRYTARINTQFKLPGNIRIGENVYVTAGHGSGFNNAIGDFGPMYMLYYMLPIIPVYDIAGNFGSTAGGPGDLGNFANPVAIQKSTKDTKNNNWIITGNVYGEVDFLKNFTFRTSFGGTIDNRYSQKFSPLEYWSPNNLAIPNSYSESSSYATSSIWTNTLTYNKEFGKHNVRVLAGSEAISDNSRAVGGSAQNFFATNFDYLVLNNGTQGVTNFSNGYSSSLYSIFGRADYSYNEKYLLAVTLRRDGSSKFGSESRYGTFPSYSAGWRVSNENFMKKVTWLNDLKIRGSYGILGSQNNLGPTNSFSLYASAFGTSYDINGSGNSVQQGFYQATIGNPYTTWEEDVVSNAGIDATFFNRLSLSLDVYKKSINGLLFPKPLPSTVGGASPPIVNVGDIQNSGVDITVKYFDKIGSDLKFAVSANITTYKNIVKEIPDPGYFNAISQQQIGNLVRNQEGQAVSSFFGYEVLGLFNSDDEVSKSPTQLDAAPGRFKYRDINGDGAISSDDRTFIGSPNPDFTYGVNLNLEYKAFDFSAFFYGSQGNEIINSLKANTHFYTSYVTNKSNDLLNAWTPTNTNTTIPKIEAQSSFSTTSVMHTFFVEDGSYLRLKSLILGYSMKPAILKRFGIHKFRLYLQGANLFTITKYSGLDPELVGPSSSFGIDWGNYPGNIKSFLFGLDFSF